MPEFRRLALVTGASSGLGEVFARKLAELGFDLILVARREDRLAALKNSIEASQPVQAEVFAADLSKLEEIERTAAHLKSQPALELLVNNAGFGTKGLFWDVPIERHMEMHNVHITATLQLSHAALQIFVPRDRGAIINVSSVAAYGRSPGAANYCATKGWINQISEGIYLDLKSRRSNVKIQSLCPGFTHTEFHQTMGVSSGSVPKWLWLPASYVVRESLKALERGQLFVIPSLRYRVIASALSKAPSALRLKMGARSPQRATRLTR
ncbi:MAG: SDR family oxidoreductase [Bryobacterales bacterium]|nr:SDR family oxidoreductase [Bryobacterales bacterium]